MSEEKKTFEGLAMEVKAMADKVADELDEDILNNAAGPSERTLMVAYNGIMHGLLLMTLSLAATENDFAHDEYSWEVYDNIASAIKKAHRNARDMLNLSRLQETFEACDEISDSMEDISNTIQDYDDSPKQREYKLALDKNLE